MNQSPTASSPRDTSNVLIWTALSAVYLIWGSTYLAIRFTVETTPPFLSAAARFIMSGAVLYLWRRFCGDPTPSRQEWRSATVIGLLLLVGGNGAVVWAARYIPSSLAALLVATCPLWMLLFDFLRRGGEKPGPRALSGIAIGFCGAVLLIGWSANGTTPNSFAGAVVVVFGSLFWAAGSIFGKTAKLPSSPLLITGMEMLSGGAALLIIALAVGEVNGFDPAQVSSRSAIGWVYLTVIGPIAFVAYAWLLRNAPIPLVSTYSYVNPLVAIILGYFLGKEILAMRVWLAAGLIIGSVALVSARTTR
ncbi:MAG: EamA family transporter [Candidatus Binatia bacterium]